MATSTGIAFLLHEVSRLFARRLDRRAKAKGLTILQWHTLAYLADNEGIHQAALAEKLDVEPITLVRIVDKLAERELVERRRHPTDRRVWLLYLRDDAHPLVVDMRALSDTTRGEALRGIPEDDTQRLREILTIMKTNLVQSRPASAADKETDHG